MIIIKHKEVYLFGKKIFSTVDIMQEKEQQQEIHLTVSPEYFEQEFNLKEDE